MQLKVFISYSTHDRQIAAEVKRALEDYNVDAFMAHEDINVSQEWKDRILEELNVCSIFIPLLSREFKLSEWAPQETGIAFAKDNVLIIPLSVDGTIPFGFIASVQGKRVPSNNDYYNVAIEPIIYRFPYANLPKLIERLSRVKSFRNAEALMLPLVPHFERFNEAEIEQFVDVCTSNGEIWDAGLCKLNYIPKFISMHRSKIPPEKLAEIEKLISP